MKKITNKQFAELVKLLKSQGYKITAAGLKGEIADKEADHNVKYDYSEVYDMIVNGDFF